LVLSLMVSTAVGAAGDAGDSNVFD
jgi:hypothetical protein